MARRKAPPAGNGRCTKNGCADRRAIPSLVAEREGLPAEAWKAKAGQTTAYPGPPRIRALALGCLKTAVAYVRAAKRSTLVCGWRAATRWGAGA